MIPEVFEAVCEKVRAGEAGEELRPALAKLLPEAGAALDAGPFAVTDKKDVPPSGTKHDYYSLSVYWWPNPDTPDGLPYVSRDGHVNPEVKDYDGPKLKQLVSAVGTLSVAYALTGDERYAGKAAGLLRVWFLDEETRMNPHLTFAQFIPGQGPFESYYPPEFVPGTDGRPGIYVSVGGAIESSKLAHMLEGVELLRQSPAWTDQDQEGLQDWFRNYMRWLLDSKLGRLEGQCDNNHGSWYMVQVAGYALFCGEEDVARSIFAERFPERVKMQIEPDGSMPIELGRSRSYGYTVGTLRSFFSVALLAERLGVDLWHYQTEDGRGLRRALDWLVPYLDGKKEWTHRLIKPISPAGAVPLLYAAALRYDEPEYRRLIDKLSDYPADSRSRLLYP